MKKFSRQRELILSSLKQRTDHPTAEKLYADLKKEMPEIGIATVYRNLSELWEEGKVLKIKQKLGPDRFDGNTVAHIHFTCEKCGELYDIFLPPEQIRRWNDEMGKIASNAIMADVSDCIITLEGICHNCKEQKEGRKKDENLCM